MFNQYNNLIEAQTKKACSFFFNAIKGKGAIKILDKPTEKAFMLNGVEYRFLFGVDEYLKGNSRVIIFMVKIAGKAYHMIVPDMLDITKDKSFELSRTTHNCEEITEVYKPIKGFENLLFSELLAQVT